MPAEECVKVVVRCRPLNDKERSSGRTNIVEVDADGREVVLLPSPDDPATSRRSFTFDKAFGQNSTQDTIYDQVARPILTSVLSGFNGTIFAYGQTGSGKTHTMLGREHPPEQHGIIPRTFRDVFATIASDGQREYLVRVSFLEVYNEEVRDLLSKDPKQRLEVHENEDGVYVKGLSSFVVRNVEEMTKVLEVGNKNRSVGATLMNQDSSRSHSIFTTTIETSETSPDRGNRIRVGKLNLVDLAGSERQSKTGATGERLKEASKINLSLSALGNVISALVDGKSGFVPYRDSKLTRLLQDSLGGNTKTVMIANCGPADYNYDETLSTLRYASRAKLIKNQPKINEDPKDAMLRQFQEEIARLRAELDAAETGPPSGHPQTQPPPRSVKSLTQEEIEALRAQLEQELLAQYAAEGRVVDAAAMRSIKSQAAAGAAAAAGGGEGGGGEGGGAVARQKQLEQEAEAVRQRNAALAKKLEALQGKLLHGNGQLKASATLKEQQVQRKQVALQELSEAEAQAGKRVAELEEVALAEGKKYGSVAEECEAKGKKLDKLEKRLGELQADIRDAYRDFQAEKESLLDQIRGLQQQVELKEMLCELFIPPRHVSTVRKTAVWDDVSQVWKVPLTQGQGPVMASTQAKRPPTAGAALRRAATAKGLGSPGSPSRSLTIQLQPDAMERTTNDYVSPMAAAQEGSYLFTSNSRGEERVFLGDTSLLDSFVSPPMQPAPVSPGITSTGMQRSATSVTMARAKSSKRPGVGR